MTRTSKPQVVDAEALNASIENAAVMIARRHNLIAEDGTIMCWSCGAREALIPSLHCGGCLGAYYGKHHITLPACLNRAQTAADREAMRR